jgi:hypothetical protein
MIHNANAKPMLLSFFPAGKSACSKRAVRHFDPERRRRPSIFNPRRGLRNPKAKLLANALELRFWDDVAVYGIMDDRALGFQFVSREQSDLAHPLDAVPTRKRAPIDF